MKSIDYVTETNTYRAGKNARKVFVSVTITKKNLRIAGFFASLPFLTYLCNKRLRPSGNTMRSVTKKIAKTERALSK